MLPSQQSQSPSERLQEEMLREFKAYNRNGRISDLPPLRLLIALALLLLCATISVMFGRYLWQHGQVSQVTKAAQQGDLVSVKRLVAAQASLVDAPGYLGRSPLWWASAGGHAEVMKFCIDRKVDLNRPDARGWTPLHAAAGHDKVAALRLLIQQKAKLGVVDKQGRNVLHAAAVGPNLQAAEALIAMGYHPDYADTAGWTALHVAVFHRQAKMVTFLITKGAGINQKTRDGLTPVGLANRMKRNDAILQILMDHGGDT